MEQQTWNKIFDGTRAAIILNLKLSPAHFESRRDFLLFKISKEKTTKLKRTADFVLIKDCLHLQINSYYNRHGCIKSTR